MNRIAAAALAGLAATVPMTFAMAAMHRHLPGEEATPLPPRQVTENLAEKAGMGLDGEAPEGSALALASHFGFGAAAGALYAPLMERGPTAPAAKGIAYALAVWAASYQGWLPALGLVRPATRQSAGRNVLMIAAHVVWGAALGVLADRLARAGTQADTRQENTRPR